LTDALVKVESRAQLKSFWRRWSLKTTFPHHPVPTSAFYGPIKDGLALKASALRFRNCSERYLAAVLEGKAAFAEFEHEGERVVIHLQHFQGEWVVDDVYARQNRTVDPRVQSAAIQHLASFGIYEKTCRTKRSNRWDALRDLTSGFAFYDDDDDETPI
jgi:hypothetical protein